MITIVQEGGEWIDDDSLIHNIVKTALTFEFSLKAMLLWEENFSIPLLKTMQDADKWTYKHLRKLVECMCLETNHPEIVESTVGQVIEYVNDIQQVKSATTIKRTDTGQGITLTAEVVYGQMAILNIPFDWDTQPLPRLLKLIETTNELNKPPKKQTQAEANRAMWEAKRKLREKENENDSGVRKGR